MAVLVVLIVVVVAVVVITKVVVNEHRKQYEAHAAAHPLDPVLAGVLRLSNDDWRARRDAENALRDVGPALTAHLHRHAEAPILVLHCRGPVFAGLLVVTSGRTLRYHGSSAGSSTDEIPHHGTTTSIQASGRDDPHPFVEISRAGRIIRFTCTSINEAQLLCAAIDCWAENPHVAGDPRVFVTRRDVCIPDAFYVDILRAAGHAVTPYNMRSIHERLGMQVHGKARSFLLAQFGERAAYSFTNEVGRPVHDKDLPMWTARTLERWIALDPDAAHVAAFVPHLARSILLESASTGGYLAHPERPLSMWKNDWYEDNGRGARRGLGPGSPPVPA